MSNFLYFWTAKFIINGSFKDSLLFAPRHTVEPVIDMCQLDALNLAKVISPIGMVYRKGWPFAKLFDRQLSRLLMETGIRERFMVKYFGKKIQCEDPKQHSANLQEVVVVLLLMAVGWIVAGLVFVVELNMKRPAAAAAANGRRIDPQDFDDCQLSLTDSPEPSADCRDGDLQGMEMEPSNES